MIRRPRRPPISIHPGGAKAFRGAGELGRTTGSGPGETVAVGGAASAPAPAAVSGARSWDIRGSGAAPARPAAGESGPAGERAVPLRDDRRTSAGAELG